MIRLSEQSPLGTGRHRKCYAHPEDAQRCIKIVYHRGDGGDKEIRRELKYYAHLGRRLKDWSKKRILTVYLNIAEFGDGVFGVEA
ncbi:YrbL family protein, partial [Escherichia coli]|uniref:YrbL family protein n=1 Tax=Escherichia coli TaxID=562 RepID=UPI000AE34C76